MRFAHRASFLRFPVRRTSPQAHGFHHNPLWRRSEKRAHPDSRLASGKRGQRGTPALTVLPIRHIAAFPCIGEDTDEELPIRSALVFVRKNIRAHIGKAGFSDKMPIHGLPFPNRRKRNAVSGPGDQLALPGKQKSFFKPHVSPLRLAFPYARCGPPSSATQAASPESKRFPDPMQPPRKDNTAPLSSWGYPPHGPA